MSKSILIKRVGLDLKCKKDAPYEIGRASFFVSNQLSNKFISWLPDDITDSTNLNLCIVAL